MAGIPPSCLLSTSYTFWTSSAPIWQNSDASAGPVNYVNGCGPALTASQQVALYQQSVSAWYAMIILCQAAHVWACKTRLNSVADHPMFRNYMTVIGVLVAALIMCFCIYVPGVQTFFATAPLAGQIFPCALVFWLFIAVYSESIKWAARNRPTWAVSRFLAW